MAEGLQLAKHVPYRDVKVRVMLFFFSNSAKPVT